jgi:hypothetical protein
MKNTIYFFCILSFFFCFCKKETTTPNTTPTDTKDYAPVSAGSTFTYSDTTNDIVSLVTITASGVNNMQFGKMYTTLSSSNGSNIYLAKQGAKYYNIASYAAMNSGTFENNYLIDSLAVGATWKVGFKIYNVLGFPDSLNAVATYKIVAKGITRGIQSKIFSNVIHVQLTDISAYSGIPPAGQLAAGIAYGDYYYALGVGLIQSKFVVEDVPSFGINAYKTGNILVAYSIK